ncbi:MAG: TetR/AcrR family transcriptional regulator [Nitrososphaera sp.]
MNSLHKAEVRERIIQAAIESFGQTGFDRTKMDDIAKRLGLSKGTIYLYFKSKEELFTAICQHNMNENMKNQALFTKKENIASDAEQIYDTIRKNERDMDKVMMEMVVESTRNPRLKKIMHEQHTMIHKHVVEEVRSKVKSGFIRHDVDIDSLATALVALYDGLAINRMLGMNEQANKKAWVVAVQALLSENG